MLDVNLQVVINEVYTEDHKGISSIINYGAKTGMFKETDIYKSAYAIMSKLEIDRYEFLIYRLLRKALEAGDVFVQDSTEFRRFEDNLSSDARWQDKDTILREIGLPILLAPIK